MTSATDYGLSAPGVWKPCGAPSRGSVPGHRIRWVHAVRGRQMGSTRHRSVLRIRNGSNGSRGCASPLMSALASTSAPQSGHTAGSGSRTSTAHCVWQPRHSPPPVSRRFLRCRRQMRPPATAVRSTLLLDQTHDTARPRRPRLEPAEDVANVQRPVVSFDRRDHAPFELRVEPLGRRRVGHRQPDSQRQLGRARPAVAPRRSRRRVVPYRQRRPLVQRCAVDRDQDLTRLCLADPASGSAASCAEAAGKCRYGVHGAEEARPG